MAEKKAVKQPLADKKVKQTRTCVWFNDEENKFIDRLVGSTLGNDRTEIVKQIVRNYLRERFHGDPEFRG